MDRTEDILDSCRKQAETAFQGTAGSRLATDAALYLAHTGMGESLRSLARATGKHPSTVMRTVRRLEQQRDDPLIDNILSDVEAQLETKSETRVNPATGQAPANENHSPSPGSLSSDLTPEEIRNEAKKYLRRLSEPGAFLFIARESNKAGVFCAANGNSRPTAMFPVPVAVEFLKQDWIKSCSRGSTSVRYKITEVGRSFLRRVLAEDQIKRQGGEVAEPASSFSQQHQERGERLFADPLSGEAATMQVNLGESPLGWLARRKGPDGRPFLEPEEIDAGERLRSDFEAAQMGPQVAQDWRRFLTPGDRMSGNPIPHGPGGGSQAARDRVHKALSTLGPGLSDITVRTCCFLEGLEACERRMGWSARSGKVVLKLALQRLAEHYGLKVFGD
ncbi:MAG: DUF6456 domain-containing protein [Paracoccaceae bacterium]